MIIIVIIFNDCIISGIMDGSVDASENIGSQFQG